MEVMCLKLLCTLLKKITLIACAIKVIILSSSIQGIVKKLSSTIIERALVFKLSL